MNKGIFCMNIPAGKPCCPTNLGQKRSGQMQCCRVCVVLFFCFAMLALNGCSSEPSSPGVVARVNGVPIYLSEVRANHDLHYMAWSWANDFDVQSLRGEYGNVLADIILQRLLEETLEAEHLAVEDEDVARKEALVRADYPDDAAFEQTLVEEYVDVEHWRKCLRSRLNRQRFIEEYLRPQVTVTYEKARNYYKKHQDEFIIPERFVFTVFQSKDREALKEALKTYKKTGNATTNKEAPLVHIHEMDVPEHSLPNVWHDHLSNLVTGEASRIITGRKTMTILLLHKKTPRSRLSSSAAYPLVEQKLVEQGMKEVFNLWLKRVLEKARIEVTGFLKDGGKQPHNASLGNASEGK